MDSDKIIEIGIDIAERLYIKPKAKSFPYIYREAMEVDWDQDKRHLYGAKPRQWKHIDWFVQILSAAKEQGCELNLANECVWVGISEELKGQIIDKTY